MDNSQILRAGAGIEKVGLLEDMLPQEGFSTIHDELHVRTLVLESNERIAIVSIEITSLFPHTQERMTELACAHAGVDREHLWLSLTHSFASPHLWKSPEPGKEDEPGPGHKLREKDEITRCERLEEAYCKALVSAVDMAVSRMSDAVIGGGTGASKVNANRNIETNEGWWIGTDDEKPCDHQIRLLRIDNTAGEALAVLYSYGVRSCVMMDVRADDGGKVVSSDLCGFASRYVEEELGNGAVALFLCGAAADQEPLFKASYEETDAKGVRKAADFRTEADALLKAQGVRLGTQVLRTRNRISVMDDKANITAIYREFDVRTKVMNRNLKELRPVKEMNFDENGSKSMKIYGIRIGNNNLIGVQPELDGQTVSDMCNMADGGLTITAIQVNGGDKCMPGRCAYENFFYQAQNSPYMPGSAEKLVDVARKLLNDLGAVCRS